MTAFHEVQFPLRLALGARGGPERRTEIVSLSNGREARNRRWRDARRRYDVGSSMKTLADLYETLAFFEARAGQLYGFRFTDPFDFKSGGPHEAVGPGDQRIGTGDGETRSFQLRKTYRDAGGESVRTIEKPVAGSVRLSVDGVEIDGADFSVAAATGMVMFSASATPGEGAVIKAGFRFDTPVRFDTDRLDIDLDAFQAGRIPSIPLVEIRP